MAMKKKNHTGNELLGRIVLAAIAVTGSYCALAVLFWVLPD
jgi:hypothetical protein